MFDQFYNESTNVKFQKSFPNHTINYPRWILVDNFDINQAIKKIKAKSLRYPLLTKVRIASRSMNKHGHDFIIIKN